MPGGASLPGGRMLSARVSCAAMAEVMTSKMMSTPVRRSVRGVGLQCDDREAGDDHEQ
jgi:hypothetical protein